MVRKTMKLSDAFLCVECEELFTYSTIEFDRTDGRRVFSCPSCGCTASIPLSRIVIPMRTYNQAVPARNQTIGNRL